MLKSNFSQVIRSLKIPALVTFTVMALLASAYNILHHYYLQRLQRHEYFTDASYQEPIFPKLSQKQVLNLGWAHFDPTTLKGPFTKRRPPKSSYTNFAESKPPHTVRIGIFGDSNVWGREVKYDFDFPTLLQDYFHEYGLHHIQVLNFGVPGYGMHQTFLMWEYLGQKYNLDFTIFLPFKFHVERDLTYIFLRNSYCPIHARYIITNVGVTLSPVMGNSRKEACSLYHRLFPPWQYIRYDRKAPAFLRVLVPEGRQFKFNPFYYSNMEEKEEALTSYEILFKHFANQANHPIIVCADPDICKLREKISGEIHFFESHVRRISHRIPSLYVAPGRHLSALGNEMRAQEMFSFLTGQRQPKLPVVTLSSTTPDFPQKQFESPPPLYEYEEIRAQINGHVAADFVTNRKDQSGWRLNETLAFKKNRISSLLWAFGQRGIRFIPVSSPLKNGDTLMASFKVDNQAFLVPIGQIEATNSIIGKISLTCGQWTTVPGSPTWRFKCENNYLTSLRIEGNGIPQEVKIIIREKGAILLPLKKFEALKSLNNIVKNIFKLKQENTIIFQPAISSVAYLRAKPGSLTLRGSPMKKTGTLDLMVRGKNEPAKTFPITTYKISDVPLPENSPVFKSPIKLLEDT